MKLHNPLDFSNLQALNMVLQNLPGAPSSQLPGRTYYDTTLNAQRTWNGTNWVAADPAQAAAGSIPNAALATNPLDRANHSGQQTASTISNFSTAVVAHRLDQFAAPTAAVAMNNQRLTGLADPTGPQDAATRGWVLTQVSDAAAGIDAKGSVRYTTTGNVALTGLGTQAGGDWPAAMTAGNRVLVKNQTTAADNGPYVVAAGAWARATDADSASELTPGAFWYVEEGATQAKTQWRIENTGTVTLGTTGITINQFGGAGATYTAGDGLALTGNSFAVKTFAGSGITVTAAGVGVDTAVVVRKFGQLIGDGSATSYTVTHNLSNQRPQVAVWEVATNALVLVDVVASTANLVTVTFAVAPAANAFYVTVQG